MSSRRIIVTSSSSRTADEAIAAAIGIGAVAIAAVGAVAIVGIAATVADAVAGRNRATTIQVLRRASMAGRPSKKRWRRCLANLGTAPPMSHELPPAPPEADGPDIIVEEIYDEPDEFYQAPAPGPEMREPTGLAEDWPAPMDLPAELIVEVPPFPAQEYAPIATPEEPHADSPADHSDAAEELPKADEPPPAESASEKEEDADEPKTKRKTPSRGKGKATKPRKPRKRAAAEDAAGGGTQACDRWIPANGRTGADDPSLGPDRAAPGITGRSDRRRSELFARPVTPPPTRHSESKFSPEPEPAPFVEAEPDEEIIIQEENFEPSEGVIDSEETESGPLEPAILKDDPDESLEELVEEEKSMGDEDEEEEIAVSEIHGDDEPGLMAAKTSANGPNTRRAIAVRAVEMAGAAGVIERRGGRDGGSAWPRRPRRRPRRPRWPRCWA